MRQLKPQFDRIIWQSLGCQRPLVEFLDRNIISSFTRNLEPPLDLEARITSLIESLSAQRCLIILDDLHQILWEGELAGNYALGYREYQQLFQRIRDTNHQSCLILLSWEKLREIEFLEGEHPALHSLELGNLGADARSIFQSYSLTDEGMWQQVIDYYSGNPRALKIVAAMVKDLFGGSVADFCQSQPLPLTVELKQIWQNHFDRLSAPEQEVLRQIATEPLSLAQLRKSSGIPPAELIDAAQSLGRRGLIAKTSIEGNMAFGVRSIVRQVCKITLNY